LRVQRRYLFWIGLNYSIFHSFFLSLFVAKTFSSFPLFSIDLPPSPHLTKSSNLLPMD
jgi:hypothetical protein